MKYAKHRSHFSKRSPAHRRGRMWVIGLALLALVFGLGIFFRTYEKREPEVVALNEALDEIVEEKTETGVVDEKAVQQITLVNVGEEGLHAGIARRGQSGETFTHVVVADLPAIDSSQQFYEGWLVKPGVTQFFSTGEMFPRADGKWGLVWEVQMDEAGEDIFDYAKVVITSEARDGDDSPSPVHLLEGTFETF